MIAVLTTVAVAALILIGVMSAITLTAVLRLRMQRPEAVLLQPQEVPREVRELLAPGLARLLELGFAHPAALRMSAMRVAGEAVTQHALVLTHNILPAAAYVMQLLVPDRGRHYSIYFVSRTLEGHTLLTRNRASISGPLPVPEVSTQDFWLPNWPAVWRAHWRRMKALQPDPNQWQRLGAADWITLGAAAEAEAFDRRVRHRELVDAGDGGWRFSLREALVMLLRAWAVFIPASRSMDGDKPGAVVAGRAALRGSPPVAAAAAAASDGGNVPRLVQAYERDSQLRRSPSWSNGIKWLVFFVTAVVAAASFGLSMGLELLPAVLVVLLFHELGHFAAMRWAGYRDLKVFFLPFIGAAVSGRHESPTARQELLVLFAGPVPGLVLGLAVALWLPADVPGGRWWHSGALLAITLNAFNLLPIHPLDGGKIFEILLLGRWPWAAFVGRVLGLAVLGYLVLTMDSDAGRTAMGAAVLLMTLGLAHQYREARLAAGLRAAGQWGGLSRSEALQALFSAMGRLGLLQRPWPDLRLMADALLPALTRPRLRRRERAGGLAVYGFFLVLPVLALLLALWPRPHELDKGAASASAAGPSSATHAADLVPGNAAQAEQMFSEVQRRVMQEPDAGRRWALLVSDFEPLLSGLSAEERARVPAVTSLLQEAHRLAPTLPDPVAKQAVAKLWQARLMADEAERRQLLKALIDSYDDPAAATADPGPLADAAIEWLYAARADAAARMVVIDKVIARLHARLDDERLSQLQEFKLDHLLAQGEPGTARQFAQDWLAAARGHADRDQGVAYARAAHHWVNLLLVTDGPAAALRAMDGVLQQLDALSLDPRLSETDALRRTGLWLAEANGDRDWQRRQVQRLAASTDPDGGMPWWMHLIFRMQFGRSGPPGTLDQMDRAHWRGDAAEATKIAVVLCQRLGANASRARISDEYILSSARQKLISSGRKAMCERYGVPTTVGT